MPPPQPTAAEQQAQASGLSSYAQRAAASVKANSNTIHASRPQQQPQQHPQQELQPKHLTPQSSHTDMHSQHFPVSTHASVIQSSQQQQQPAASRQPGYATNDPSVPPQMPPSSTLLSSHASHPLHAHPHHVYAPMQLPSVAALPGSTPPGLTQQQQQMLGQQRGEQAGSQAGLQQGGGPLPPQQQAVGQGLAARQATAVQMERMQQRPASVPANSLGGSLCTDCQFLWDLVGENIHAPGFCGICLKSWHSVSWHYRCSYVYAQGFDQVHQICGTHWAAIADNHQSNTQALQHCNKLP